MGRKTIQVSGFPLGENADSVKDFLEKITGSGTIYALKLRHPKRITSKSRAYAIVQFLEDEHAKKIANAADRGTLRTSTSYLNFRYAQRDIVPKPRTQMFALQDVTLHFGCLVSERILSVLWSRSKVEVNFGFNMKKLYFYMSYGRTDYKLELSYESIWEIQLYRSRAERTRPKFLLIQVEAAPKIYELLPRSSGEVYEDPLFNYSKDYPDDQWVRSTDFSPSASIGQSSILCLQISRGCTLPNIRDYFVYYEEFDDRFELRSGSSFSCNTLLVPIVKAPGEIEVPYEILFKINHMVQNGTLSGPTLDDKFFRLVSPRSVPIDYINHALERMSFFRKTCLNPASWLSEQYSKIRSSRYRPKAPTSSLGAGLVYVHRVQVTPSKVYFYGPEVNVSNRVLRHFSADINNFIRVSFVDEDCDRMYSNDLSPRSNLRNGTKRTSLYNRILSVLRNGISISEKKFEFLAFSSSQLRENSAWMFASRSGLTAADIRRWMGDFREIRNVAKHAARLGQSFSSSTETLTVHKDEVESIPDIRNGTNYVFSDGIGKISPDFAKKVASKCSSKSSTPSAFQIRYGGYKGVVAVDPRSSKKLSLRRSMLKFESENTKLDVLAYSKYQPCYLNRQLITLLSTLGIRDHVFETKQEGAVQQLNRILTDPHKAFEAVELMPLGETTNVVKEMLMCGYQPDREPYLSMLLQTFRECKLLEMRTKSRIIIPQGRALMGCLDETRTLEYGQVFVQVSSNGNESDYHNFVVKGKVVVAKNPCLHPGDIRVLRAVDVPELHHMVNCVVFPQKGKRPHPNECSGSDLDGDIYFVSWDSALIPPRVVSPMDYTPAPTEILDHDVTIEEIMVYFTNYIVNDNLGIICNTHVVFADKEELKAESTPCIELAKLSSIAVDFPKTGVPAEIPTELSVKEYPDFMEKLDKVTYESKRVIGKLYRAIKNETPHPGCTKHFTKEVARRSYDRDMIVEGFEDYLDDAVWFKEQYDFKLGNLMDHYGIKTEAEIVSGCILKMSKFFSRNKDSGEAIRVAVKSLRKEGRSWFNEKSTDDEHGEDGLYAKASAWYHVTYHPDYWGCYNDGLNRPHFISFPWCVYDKLLLIKRKKVFMRKLEPDMSSIVHRVEQDLAIH